MSGCLKFVTLNPTMDFQHIYMLAGLLAGSFCDLLFLFFFKHEVLPSWPCVCPHLSPHLLTLKTCTLASTKQRIKHEVKIPEKYTCSDMNAAKAINAA